MKHEHAWAERMDNSRFPSSTEDGSIEACDAAVRALIASAVFPSSTEDGSIEARHCQILRGHVDSWFPSSTEDGSIEASVPRPPE